MGQSAMLIPFDPGGPGRKSGVGLYHQRTAGAAEHVAGGHRVIRQRPVHVGCGHDMTGRGWVGGTVPVQLP